LQNTNQTFCFNLQAIICKGLIWPNFKIANV
jgi:hypothetical protein